jgi:hypothetical protein
MAASAGARSVGFTARASDGHSRRRTIGAPAQHCAPEHGELWLIIDCLTALSLTIMDNDDYHSD